MRQQTGSSPTSSPEPAEGRADLALPGADHDTLGGEPGRTPDPGVPTPGQEAPDAPEAELPERLGERIERGPADGIASGEPDLMPNVEVPQETM